MENRGRTRRGINFGNEDPQKNFICDICNEQLPNNHKLLSHKRRHNITGVINYSENSNDGNTQEEDNKVGMKETDNDNAIGFRCEQCGKVLPTRKGLFLHDLKLHKKRSLEVDKLQLEPTNENEVANRINCVGPQEFQCEKNIDVSKPDDNIFQAESFTELKSDPQAVDAKENEIQGMKLVIKGVSEFHCGTCGKTLNSRRGLILHEVRSHNRKRVGVQNGVQKEKIVGVKCDKCGQVFKSEKKVFQHDLKVHQQKDENSTEKNVSTGEIKCEKCWKTFTSAKGLIFHEVKVHNRRRKGRVVQFPSVQKYIYKCRYCIYATKLSVNLQKHERIHLPDEQRRKIELAKIRHCHLCSYSSSDNSNFAKHLAQTHKLGNPRKCSLCPYQTFSALTLHSHMKRQHKIKRSPSSTTCSQCNTKFESLNELRCHRWKQMGMGKSCGDVKRSKVGNNLPLKPKPTKPINITPQLTESSQVLPTCTPQPLFLHQCQLCDKKFATKTFLKKHFNYVHGKSNDTQEPSLNAIKSESEQSFQTPKVENKMDVVIKTEKDDSPNREFQVKEKELLEPKEPEAPVFSTPAVQQTKLVYKTDTPHLQCQFCYVVCWDELALVNHLKRHR